MPSQSGFSILETLSGLIVAGGLAAIAAPKLADLQTASRIAVLQSTQGSALAAASMGNTKALVSHGNTGRTDEFVFIRGKHVRFNYGYPAATADGIALLVDISFDNGKACGAGCYEWVLTGTDGLCKTYYLDATSSLSSADRRAHAGYVVEQC